MKGSAHVKTGTMAYVRGLAGYIDTAAGHRLAFAIFFNDADKRAALDAAFDPHVVAIDAASRRWRNRAIGVEAEADARAGLRGSRTAPARPTDEAAAPGARRRRGPRLAELSANRQLR